MKPTRREVIALLGGLPLLPACEDGGGPVDSAPEPAPERPPEPAPWAGEGALDLDSFAWGVQVGDASGGTALLSVRSLEPALRVVLLQADGEAWAPAQTLEDLSPVEGVLQRTLSGLAEDTAYTGVVTSADGARRSEVFRFRTATGASAHRVLRIGATSCLGSANPGWANLGFAAAESLDAFLLLGDTVYADGSVTVDDYRAFWKRALSTDTLRATLNSAGLVATWDDHEVDNNWTLGVDVTVEQVQAATAAFREALPQGQGPGGALWRKVSWGAILDVFVLDVRGERDLEAGQILSPTQLAWFIEALGASTARFKVVMTSVHFTDHQDLFGSLQASDRWQGFPEQRQAALEAALAVPGVLWLTGDMHYGGVCRVAPAGQPGFEQFEVAAGPSGSFLNELVAFYEPSEQYLTFIADWSWCLLELDPGTGQVRVQFIGDAGQVLAEQALQL